MSFPAYPTYKESGCEWLGKVPEHWQALALSRVLAAPIADGPHTTPEFLDSGVPFLSVDGIQDGKLFFDGCRYVSLEDHKEFSKKAAPKYNDLLMGKAASIGKIARVTENIEFSIWSPLALIRVNERQCSPEFLEFCLKSSELQHQVLLASNSNTQLNIGMKDIPKLRIPLPTVQVQTQIARFLDHETARIDALIEEQQRLIELLKEKRQAVISHAVTKGLDPTVQMKDSGVEWLGEVPAHWEANALNKLTVKITNGYVGPTRDILVESGVPYVQATHIKKGVVNFDDAYFVTPEWSMKMRKSILQEGDVLIVQTGAGTGDVGVVSSREVGYNCHALIILQAEKNILSGVFLGQVLQSRFGQSVLYSIRTGGMHPHLNCGEVKFVKIPVPPLSEQEEISDFVKTFSEQAEMLIIEAGSTMNLLQERRSALISAAVTGKIDVRGWQPPASASSPESAQEAV